MSWVKANKRTEQIMQHVIKMFEIFFLVFANKDIQNNLVEKSELFSMKRNSFNLKFSNSYLYPSCLSEQTHSTGQDMFHP